MKNIKKLAEWSLIIIATIVFVFGWLWPMGFYHLGRVLSVLSAVAVLLHFFADPIAGWWESRNKKESSKKVEEPKKTEPAKVESKKAEPKMEEVPYVKAEVVSVPPAPKHSNGNAPVVEDAAAKRGRKTTSTSKKLSLEEKEKKLAKLDRDIDVALDEGNSEKANKLISEFAKLSNEIDEQKIAMAEAAAEAEAAAKQKELEDARKRIDELRKQRQ